MKKTEKIFKMYEYNGLGFPVLLVNVPFILVRGEWLPKIDVDKVASRIFKLLPRKSSKLTGNEIKFIRTYLDKSKPAFGEIFRLSHTAVTKWEKAGNRVAPIAPSQEIALRLYLEDYLEVSEKEFYKAYKSSLESVHNEEDVPLKVAL